jgi:hypothetical protein
VEHPQNLNIRAAFVHVLGDLVQSLGVLVAAIVIKYTGFALADPICTFLFSILVLLTTVPVFGDTLTILVRFDLSGKFIPLYPPSSHREEGFLSTTCFSKAYISGLSIPS